MPSDMVLPMCVCGVSRTAPGCGETWQSVQRSVPSPAVLGDRITGVTSDGLPGTPLCHVTSKRMAPEGFISAWCLHTARQQGREGTVCASRVPGPFALGCTGFLRAPSCAGGWEATALWGHCTTHSGVPWCGVGLGAQALASSALDLSSVT